MHHWLEDEGDRPVYKLEDGDYGDKNVEQDDSNGPADPIEDSAGPGEIDVHCVCMLEAREEPVVRVYPYQWNRAGRPEVDWIALLARDFWLVKRRRRTAI